MIVALLAAAVAATAPVGNVDASALQGHWALIRMGPDQFLPSDRSDLTLDGAKISGRAFCNSYWSQKYKLDKDRLVAIDTGQTSAACYRDDPKARDPMKDEYEFLTVVFGKPAIELKGDLLFLHGGHNELEFMRLKP